jgi:hypothetical protein
MEEDQVQEWLTAEITVLIPKNEHNKRLNKIYTCNISAHSTENIAYILSQGFHKYTNDNTLMSKDGKCSSED